MHVPLLARAASAHQQSRYHRVAIKLHAPLLARAASHNGVGTMSTWKVLGDEKAYLTVFMPPLLDCPCSEPQRRRDHVHLEGVGRREGL